MNSKRTTIKPEHFVQKKQSNIAEELDILRSVAENKQEWINLVAEIYKVSAEAVRSEDPASKRAYISNAIADTV
ncbi:hypothetical protein PoB_003980700 [Plakobranchus ocellatus]|uniref:Uncharacterized protein n=1 Tax=Plakobranchus ocellatus TaxID=259542 RepID=A0AAV4B253_9GAST|nr:hypothetical protein PoB_003980700 [Plakobranchus ocellatus]